MREIATLLERGRVHEAVEHARHHVMRHAEDEAAWQLLVEATTAARRWDDLAQATTKALERFPTAAWAWHAALMAALGLGDAEDAVRVGLAGLRAIRAKPGNASSARIWEAMGHAFWRLGDLDGVLGAVAAIRDTSGDLALADLLEMRVSLARGDLPRAKALGERLLDADADALEPMSLQCAALIALGEGHAAAPLAARLVKVDPTSPTVWSMRATVHALNHEPELACEAQRRALALRPTDGALRIALVMYQLAARRPDAAKADAQSLIEDRPADPTGWRLLGLAARASGDDAFATQCEARAVELHEGLTR
jgi:predicted Zn-dependent protease